MDRLTAERRSWNMSRIKGRNTVPEKRVCSLLHRLGFRFSLHNKNVPGRPDIVLKRLNTAIFVHGCFWHRHARCKNSVLPKTRADFWLAKLTLTPRRSACEGQRPDEGIHRRRIHIQWILIRVCFIIVDGELPNERDQAIFHLTFIFRVARQVHGQEVLLIEYSPEERG